MPNYVMKSIRLKYLIFFVCAMFLAGCFLSLLAIPSGIQEKCKCDTIDSEEDNGIRKHLLGVIVPFRDRFEELIEFAPHIQNFLSLQKIKHKIFIINQIDHYRFNRASLINIGFLIAQAEGCDYIAMHDVDLLPLNQGLSYDYPENGVYHIAAPEIHPLYHYPTFVGGILLIKKEDFLQVNGMSNKYWGWGMEDDEFYMRLKTARIKINRPSNLTTSFHNSFRHLHDQRHRKRDRTKCYTQWEVTRRVHPSSGLKDLSYTLHQKRKLEIDGSKVTLINAELRCNRSVTPWCLCSESKMKSGPTKIQMKQSKNS